MRRKLFIGTGIAMLLLSSVLWLAMSIKQPADVLLIANFHRHRSDFEKIARMADEDRQVKYVSVYGVYLTGYVKWTEDKQRGFSNRRWQEYQEIFNGIGFPYVVDVSKDSEGLKLSTPFRDGSEIGEYQSINIQKGYLYSRTAPAPLVHSLDARGLDNGIYYRKIDENWYLYREWGGSKPE